MVRILMADAEPLFGEDIFENCVRLLPDVRLQKINRLKNMKDKCLSVASWFLLREGARLFDKNADVENIMEQKGGKPYLVNAPHIHFSISHSGNMAMCAVSLNPVGADIQHICNFNEEICRRYFTSGECNYVMSADSASEKTARFFGIWTCKEAYSKMTGRGLFDFLNFEVAGREDKYNIANSDDVYFHTSGLLEYKLAVCTAGKTEAEYNELDIMSLME